MIQIRPFTVLVRDDTKPHFDRPQRGQNFHFLNALYTAKINSEHSNGALTAMESLLRETSRHHCIATTSRTNSPNPIEGELWFSCGDVEAVHSAGAVVWLPRGLPHTFQVRCETARLFQVSTPAQFERFVATLGRPAEQPVIPEPEEIDPGHVAEICKQFEVLGPPPEPVTPFAPSAINTVRVLSPRSSSGFTRAASSVICSP